MVIYSILPFCSLRTNGAAPTPDDDDDDDVDDVVDVGDEEKERHQSLAFDRQVNGAVLIFLWNGAAPLVMVDDDGAG
jgi:hypothetical protein